MECITLLFREITLTRFKQRNSGKKQEKIMSDYNKDIPSILLVLSVHCDELIAMPLTRVPRVPAVELIKRKGHQANFIILKNYRMVNRGLIKLINSEMTFSLVNIRFSLSTLDVHAYNCGSIVSFHIFFFF